MGAKNPPRRKWWWMIGNKEDRFIWQGGNSGKVAEEVLYKPNFEYDAEQIIIANNKQEEVTTEDGSLNSIDIDITEKKRLIDQRMHALSSLFISRRRRNDDRSTDNGHRDNSLGIRATDLTDDEFINFVLNGTHNPVEKEQLIYAHAYNNQTSDDTTISEHGGMTQIIQKYLERREEKRNLANTYIADRRSILPEPWVEREDGEQSSIQIDRHGRLVRTRRESNNDVAAAAANDDGEGDDADATESSNDGIEELELVDATEVFWKQHKKSNNDDSSRGGGRRRRGVASTVPNTARPPPIPGVQQPQQPPPLPHNPLNQQHIRERSIAQQMENDSRQAIERAIHRYRGQQQERQERDEAIFEMIHIPLVRPINEENVLPRWLRFLSFTGGHQQQQHGNNNAGENLNQQQQNNDPNEQEDQHNGERDWIDLRLALRRICFAVITVVAAFICMILQGLPGVDFGDDGEVDTIFLSGLMGPHYPGHHPQQHHHQPRHGEVIFQEMSEEEVGDIQQSIWNRLGTVDDRYHLQRRDAVAEGATAQSSNHGGGEL